MRKIWLGSPLWLRMNMVYNELNLLKINPIIIAPYLFFMGGIIKCFCNDWNDELDKKVNKKLRFK